LFDRATKDVDDYKQTILKRFSAPEVKDELIRVARNPLIKFNKSERFHAPLDLLLKNSSNIETFQSVFQILLNEDLDDIDGFKEFKKLFQNGTEEFFTDFWNVDSDLEIYLSKLK
jgi:mannitol-1-phosphate/altronate dehydrogenase